jgi:selenocysteine-specific elongation factor
VIRALLDEAAPRPLPREAIASRFIVPAEMLSRAAETLVTKGELARIKNAAWIKREALVDLASKARRLVEDHHKKAPLDRGLVLETLRKRLAAVAGEGAAEEVLRVAASKNTAVAGEPIVIEGDIAKLANFTGAPASASASGPVGAAARAIGEAGLKGVSEHGAREATGAAPREVKAILAKLVREGVAVHAGELWFARAAVDDLRARIVAHFEKSPRLTIADFKTISGLGRKQAIPLLELFDREGVTRRDGDDRVRPGST